jgi:hypothetical protein
MDNSSSVRQRRSSCEAFRPIRAAALTRNVRIIPFPYLQQGGIYKWYNTYQIVLMDAEEGGIEWLTDARTAQPTQSNVIYTDLFFNNESVVSYEAKVTPVVSGVDSVTEIETGYSYRILVPRFGYSVVWFDTSVR